MDRVQRVHVVLRCFVIASAIMAARRPVYHPIARLVALVLTLVDDLKGINVDDRAVGIVVNVVCHVHAAGGGRHGAGRGGGVEGPACWALMMVDGVVFVLYYGTFFMYPTLPK